MTATLQFQEEILRKVKTGQIPRTFLLQENSFSISMEISENVLLSFWQLFKNNFIHFIKSSIEGSRLAKAIGGCLFMICLFLEYRSLKSTKQRMKKTESLFRIVPPFMRQKVTRNQAKPKNTPDEEPVISKLPIQ